MEFRFLIIVFFSDIVTAPLAKEAVTIMGSISGVKPTAIEMANRNASIQFPLVKPLMNNTMGTMASINRINTQETELTPFSKLVSTSTSTISTAISPKTVSSPVAITTPMAAPLITLVPMNAKLG